MKRHALAAALLTFGCAAPSAPPPVAYIPDEETQICKITKVVDGDTVHIACRGGAAVSTRLVGYDTPETYQPRCTAEAALGQKATAFLETKLRSANNITPRFEGTDKYNRALVALTLEGQPLAHIMVNAGLAQPYSGRTKRPDWCAILAARER